MTITTNDQGIRIELHGREQLAALRAKVEVPRPCIQDVRFEARFQDWRKVEVRMPGTNAPRLLLAGSYWTEEGWDFLYIKRPHGFLKPLVENVLVIETDQNRYRRVIVSIEPTEAEALVKWWKKQKSASKSRTKQAADSAPPKKKIVKRIVKKISRKS